MMRKRDAIRNRVRSAFGSVALARGSDLAESYNKARRDYQKTRKAVSRAMLKQVQRDYRNEQALADIARQLREPSPQDRVSDPPGHEADTPDASDPLSIERLAVLVALFEQPKKDTFDERQRRSNAVKAVIKLCQRQEPGTPHARHSKRSSPLANEHNFSDRKRAPYPMRCNPTQCIFCLGNAALESKARQRSFRDFYTLRTHFEVVHLDHLPDDEAIECPHPECNETLRNKEHLQNHALRVHNTRT
jgi:hypothetical protein